MTVKKQGNSFFEDKKLVFMMGFLAIFWGMSFFGSNVALKYMNTFQILAVRWTVSMCIFLVLIAAGRIRIHIDRNFPWLFLTGIFQPCVYSIFETEGVRLTSTSECSIFIAAMPGMVLLTGILFLKKKSSPRIITGIIMAFLGVIVCTAFAPGFRISAKIDGYLILVGAVLSGTIYAHCSGKAGETYSTLEVTAIISIAGGIFFNAASVISGNGFSGFTQFVKHVDGFVAVMFLGIFCSCICYLIFNYVLGKMNTAVATNISASSTTAVGVISGILFAGDPGGWYTFLGLILTIGGLWISGSDRNGGNRTEEENSIKILI